MHDRFELIACYGRLAVAILGNPTTSEFVLIDLTEPLPDLRSEAQRGFCFIGAVGIVQGVRRVALAEPLDNASLDALSQANIQHTECVLEGRIRATAPGGDSEQWLWRLWSLQDPRNG
jgi:hypothetical protein